MVQTPVLPEHDLSEEELACVEVGEEEAEAILEADVTPEAVPAYFGEHVPLVVAEEA